MPPITWFLSIPSTHKAYLGAIRHWPALNMAVADDTIWVSGLDPAQLASVAVQTIPYKTVYYSNGDKLFRQGSLLPDRPIPALLWSPIERGLPVTLPPFRGNYVDDQPLMNVKIVPAESSQETVALLTRLVDLTPYLQTAPAIRLQALRWVLLDADRALLVGTPVLPVPGNAFWQRGDFLLPAGYDLDLFILTDLLNTLLNPDGQHLVVWQTDSVCFPVPKRALQPLTISSFRASISG